MDTFRVRETLETLSGQLLFRWNLLRIKISTEEFLFQSRYFCIATTFSEQIHFWTKVLLQKRYFLGTATLWKKLIFQKSYIIPHYLLFLENHFFRSATFSKDLTFHSSYFFRRVTFSQHTFSQETLFYTYTSFPQLHHLCAVKEYILCICKKILFDRRCDEPLSIYSRFVGMTI